MVTDTFPAKRRITLIGALVNLVLAVFKVLSGVIGQSQALVADGIHSLSDLVSDGLVLFAARLGSQRPDRAYPYGYQRFETLATVVIGLLLLAVAAGFIIDAGYRLLDPESLSHPGWVALPAAVVSVLAKEAAYRYTRRVGLRVRSGLIVANAWHHRSDALSSLVVIIGIAGAMAGFPWFDAVAAIVVASMIAAVGWRFVWRSLRELVDSGLEEERLRELSAIVDAIDGVVAHHDLRTRHMGETVLVDIHIEVDGDLSVREGHRIGEEVHDRLVRYLQGDAEVLVHLDPA